MKKALKVIIFFLLIVISVITFYIGRGYFLYKNAIRKMPIEELLQKVKNNDNYYSISEVPEIYIQAVIAVEDHRFYSHRGLDFVAIGRAFLHDLYAMDFIEGGSTITQQVAKNNYFSQEKTIERKIAEAFMALRLEKELSKSEILELYFNTSYFGSDYYTIKEASIGYFGKEPKDMTDNESTMLAGIPNAPSLYTPKKNPELAKKRQQQVLRKMVKYKYLTEEEMKQILDDDEY